VLAAWHGRIHLQGTATPPQQDTLKPTIPQGIRHHERGQARNAHASQSRRVEYFELAGAQYRRAQGHVEYLSSALGGAQALSK
jgi:hypothetical protein